MRTLFARGGGVAQLHHRIRASHAMVTAELAIGLLAVMPVLFGVLMLVSAAGAQVQVVEAARTAARMMARGESQAVARAHVSEVIPQSQMTVTKDGSSLEVQVRRRLEPAGVLPAFTVTGSAVTIVEEGGSE